MVLKTSEVYSVKTLELFTFVQTLSLYGKKCPGFDPHDGQSEYVLYGICMFSPYLSGFTRGALVSREKHLLQRMTGSYFTIMMHLCVYI